MAIIFDNNSNRHSPPRQHDHADMEPMGTADMITMFDKFKVEPVYLDMVVSQLEKIRPFLLGDTYYTWQDLLGDEFWADMPSLPRHLASVCLQHIAAQPDSQLKVLPYCGGDPTYFCTR